MKKYLIYSLLIVFGFLVAACGGAGTQETSLQLNDANGDPDTTNAYNSKADEEYVIKLTANGIEKEFKYVDATNPRFNDFDKKKDGSYMMAAFTRGSHGDMREKITLVLVKYDLEQLTYPYEISKSGAEVGKASSLVYEVKKSNMPLQYFNNNNFDMKLTSYKDGVLEGTFAGEVTNAGNKKIKIENGSFKIKLNKNEMP